MLKKGLTRDLLILLATLVDEIDAFSYKNIMRRISCDGWYKRSSVGPTVSRLLSVGEIEKVEKGGSAYYRLTSRGSNKLKENIPILNLAAKPWDGRWRIVIFDIKETKKFLRDAFRFKLLSLGFGQWQKSVYLSPHEIEQEINQYLQAKHLFPSAVCLVARQGDLGDDRALANRVWKLDDLNDDYQEFIEDCLDLGESMKKNRINEEKIRNLWFNYEELIMKDPYLPKELLPKEWLAGKARREFSQLWRQLTEAYKSLKD